MSQMILALTPLLAQYGPRGDGWGQHMMGNWGTGWTGMLMSIAIWILIIVGGIFLVRWLMRAGSGQRSATGNGDNALEILKQRYARGEIDRNQYESMKRDLLR